MRLKSVPLYLTPDEKERFTTFANEHKQSISKSIISLAISQIAQSSVVIPDSQEIIQLKSKIEFLESRLKTLEEEITLPPKDTYQRIARQIYNLINIEWINVDQIRTHFEINSEEENEDFNIGWHTFQITYLQDNPDIEFNSFKNAYRRKTI
ncbi:hypothetical protein KKF61_09225 [Patescibacteria group bacterium]|nr:hypothetical protein [Patescibacteria group bacterium]